jgi:hypothetical protein
MAVSRATFSLNCIERFSFKLVPLSRKQKTN